MFVTTVQRFVIGRTYDWYQIHIKHCTADTKKIPTTPGPNWNFSRIWNLVCKSTQIDFLSQLHKVSWGQKQRTELCYCAVVNCSSKSVAAPWSKANHASYMNHWIAFNLFFQMVCCGAIEVVSCVHHQWTTNNSVIISLTCHLRAHKSTVKPSWKIRWFALLLIVIVLVLFILRI